MIIEARQKGVKPASSTDAGESQRPQETTGFGGQIRTPTTSRRKGPPPGLSISAPSASQFANDRVIQSAPMHQTFTGLRPGEQPFTRHTQLGPSGLSQTSHIHHVPATQTNNRLPPISDVFANDRLDAPRNYPSTHSPRHSSHSNAPPPIPSPGFPAPQYAHAPPVSDRSRDFRSADEAVQGLSGGRDDLLPKVVHYGGVQPPTPPSPMPTSGHAPSYAQSGPGAQHQYQPHTSRDGPTRPDLLTRTSSLNSSRRRGRDEYERDNGSPPLSSFQQQQHQPVKRASFAVRGTDEPTQQYHQHQQPHREDDWRAQMSGAEKREEFLRLCERAWDLFHS